MKREYIGYLLLSVLIILSISLITLPIYSYDVTVIQLPLGLILTLGIIANITGGIVYIKRRRVELSSERALKNPLPPAPYKISSRIQDGIKYCRRCGKPNQDSVQICTTCGKLI